MRNAHGSRKPERPGPSARSAAHHEAGDHCAASPASTSSATLTKAALSCAMLPVGAGAALEAAEVELELAMLLVDALLGAGVLELLADEEVVEELLLADHTLEELELELVLCTLLDVEGGGGGGGGGVEDGGGGGGVEDGGGGGGGGVEDGGGGGGGGGGSPPPTVQVAPQARSSKKPKKLAIPGVQSRPFHGQPGHWRRERSVWRARGHGWPREAEGETYLVDDGGLCGLAPV